MARAVTRCAVTQTGATSRARPFGGRERSCSYGFFTGTAFFVVVDVVVVVVVVFVESFFTV
ncbi:MAG: hypothetical protein ACYCVL_04560, partial [Gemmatimonadaceae bacterium]